jgi:hypothetical protein
MSVPAYQDIYIELPLHGSESLKIAPWDHLMAMDQADAEITYLDYLSFRQRLHIYIEVSLDCMHLRFG